MSSLQRTLKLTYIPVWRLKASPRVVVVAPTIDSFSAMTLEDLSGVPQGHHKPPITSAAEDIRATQTVS